MNKTIVFHSPIEGRDVLVRTGSISDKGLSYYHALLYSYSKDYINLDFRGRTKLVDKLRESLESKMVKASWEDSLLSKIPFIKEVSSFFSTFYKEIDKKKGKYFKNMITEEIYEIIVEMVPLFVLEKECLTPTYDKLGDKKIRECRDIILKKCKEYFDDKLKDYKEDLGDTRCKFCSEKFSKLTSRVLDLAEEEAYREYKRKSKNDLELDSTKIGLISDRLNRDVYFLNGETRLPYKEGEDSSNIKGRKSIIVIWTGGSHYEIVGRLKTKNRVQREFDKNDPLISRIKTFVYNPERVPENYPALIQYLKDETASPKSSRRSQSSSQRSGNKSRSGSNRSKSSDRSKFSKFSKSV